MELNKFLETMNVLKNYCYLDYSKSNEANKRFIFFNGNNCNYDNSLHFYYNAFNQSITLVFESHQFEFSAIAIRKYETQFITISCYSNSQYVTSFDIWRKPFLE